MTEMAKPLTGRKVLMIAVGAFGVIIAVNLVMAWQAVSTFPGLEVDNSYVASQTFNEEKLAQDALGWTVSPEYSDGKLSFVIRDEDGLPARVAEFKALVGRTTHVRDDMTPDFDYVGGIFTTKLDLAPGVWLVHLDAKAADGTEFRQRIDLFVKG
ncbi:nitrogen fixation protein FixH [Thioclava sp. ES.031]|uniref:FixH family protein n=1 Tax=unclassified Thioclava TaxID=2621713 RepID=UPI000C011B90|nr:nitrogen fixation protein FixH [Thioclava sp. ES.031]